MACAICKNNSGFFGGGVAFTCPYCKKEVCKECAEKYGNPTNYGGLFGDKHAQITCPNCHRIIEIR